MGLPPTTFRYPFALQNQPPDVVQAHQMAFNAVFDLQNAIKALKSQIDAKTVTTVTTTSSGGSVPVPTPFPGLGAVRDLTGSTSYTVLAADNGILLILSDASPVAVALDSAMVTPYFLFATNFGAGLVTFTPTSGLINGGATYTLAEGFFVEIVFDGTNWKTSAVVTIPNFADSETPSGSGTTFTLAHAPNPAASLELYVNGLLQIQGTDYTLSSNTITYGTAPTITTHKAWYRY